ncbi:hypothetical protein G6660_08975 [Polynucleobacter paneuropaeus]|nr:hypothetical protein [Polynucleobacter paneuropaeus]
MSSEDFKLNCSKCGAQQSYSPGQQTLKCEYCSAETEIPVPQEELVTTTQVHMVVPLVVDKTVLEGATQGYMVTGDFTPDNLLEKAVITKQWLNYVPIYMYVGSYDAQWTATFGFDRTEHYTEYVTKYENGRSFKVPETKTKTVTDWRPVNGTDAGKFATHAYAGTKLNPKAVELIEGMHLGDNKPQVFKQEYIAGIDVEDFSFSDSDVYSSRAESKVNAIIGYKVRSHAQGDHQRDWHWTAQIEKKYLSALVPIAHSVFEYEGKEYNVWIDGSDPSKLIGDALPVDENKKRAVTLGYVPLGFAVFAILIDFLGFQTSFDGTIVGLSAVALGLGYLYFYLRKNEMLNYSKAIRNAYLNRKQANSVDTASLSTEEKDKMVMAFVKPAMPLMADTEKDKFVLPGVSLICFLLAFVPGYMFYKSMQPNYVENEPAQRYSAPAPQAAPEPVAPPAQVDNTTSAPQQVPQTQTQSMSPKAQDLYNQAEQAFKNKEYDKALTLLQVANSIDPSNQKILNGINYVKNAQASAVNNMQIK